MNLREGLGFKQLSNQEKEAYNVMLKAFLSLSISINCSNISREVDLMKVMQVVLGDNPSVIYFNKTQIKIEESISGRRIKLVGINLKSQAKSMNLKLSVTANLIVSSIRKSSTDDYSLLINTYEFLQKNIKYDDKLLNGSHSNTHSHNAYGALLNKVAVCDGFSSAFALLAQKLGFECMLVIGDSTRSQASSSKHAWNIVKVQNKYYHMDVTWDAIRYNEYKEYSYTYFALKDQEIAADHIWDRNTTPPCIYSDFSYFWRNGLYASDREQLCEIINSLRDNNILQFKLSKNMFLPNNQAKYLTQIVTNETLKIGRSSQINYSWDGNTRCFFGKITYT